MGISPLIDRLIEAFQVLPGVGPKGAQRMTLQILQHNRVGGGALAATLAEAIETVGQCQACRTLCEQPLCRYCDSSERDDAQLCIVESPADIIAIEQAGGFRGRYFVLHGHLSPIDRVGPEELGLEQLLYRVRKLRPAEVILATNPTVEGEATAIYLSKLIKPLGVKVTRIAMGIPVGSELDYADEVTMGKALEGRREY